MNRHQRRRLMEIDTTALEVRRAAVEAAQRAQSSLKSAESLYEEVGRLIQSIRDDDDRICELENKFGADGELDAAEIRELFRMLGH